MSLSRGTEKKKKKHEEFRRLYKEMEALTLQGKYVEANELSKRLFDFKWDD